MALKQGDRKIDISKVWQNYYQTRDSALREKLILQYVPLVKYVAERVIIGLPSYLDSNDLVNYGVLGLIESIERFDPNRGVKFETYAIARIRGAIFDGLNVMDWFPSSLRAKMRKLEKAYQALEQQLGRPAKDEELAEFMNITEEKLHTLIAEVSCLTLGSLDEVWNSGDADSKELTLKDVIEDPSNPSPTAEIELEDVKRILGKAIDKLPPQERLLVSLYYYEGLTAKEISRVMEVSSSRISQLHSKAILRLRGSLSRMKQSLIG